LEMAAELRDEDPQPLLTLPHSEPDQCWWMLGGTVLLPEWLIDGGREETTMMIV
ncbi:hypothetical protein U1Q18_038082, partial [Sarracenia purpurea var. burkii]